MKLQAEHLRHCILVVYIQRHNQNLPINYSRKKLHLRCSTGFWIYFWYTCKNCCRKRQSFLLRLCCYLHSQKVWASITQNHDMFQKKLLFLTDQISLKIIFKTFFVDFGRDFSCSVAMFLSKAPTKRYQKIWSNFCSIVFLFASAPKAYLRFLKFCFTNWEQ